jgi:hypothetical protein
MFINHGLTSVKPKFISYWLDNPSSMGSKLRYNRIILQAKTESTRFNLQETNYPENQLGGEPN